MLRTDVESVLVFIDLAAEQCRLGGSALAQVYGQVGSEVPDVESTAVIRDFFVATRELMHRGHVLSYHDRSDGGLFVTLAEMAFAGRCGIEVDLGDGDPLAVLFNEELGAVLQIEKRKVNSVFQVLKDHRLESHSKVIGNVESSHSDISFTVGGHATVSPMRARSSSDLVRDDMENSDYPGSPGMRTRGLQQIA